jgi:hypothetical protein
MDELLLNLKSYHNILFQFILRIMIFFKNILKTI